MKKIKQFGDYSQQFQKLDENNNGCLTRAEFKDICKRYSFNFNFQEIELLFKSFISADTLNVHKKFSLQTPIDALIVDEENMTD